MRKKSLIITLLTTLFIIQGVFASVVSAEKSKDLENIQTERKEVQEDLSDHETHLNELYGDIQELSKEVTRLDELLLDKESKVEELTYEIDTTIEEIATIQDEIEQLNVQIEERFDLLKSRASSYQKSGGLINYIEVLFGSQDFGDFISRLTAVNQIMDSDAALMEELEKDIALVESHQTTTMEKLDDLNEMHEEQEVELVQMEEEKKEQENSKQALQAKQDELTAYVEELELEDTELAAMEDEVKSEIAEAAKREREEREEERRLAIEQKEKEERAKKEAEKEAEEAKLVQVSKVEPKNNNEKDTSSSSKKNTSTTENGNSNKKQEPTKPKNKTNENNNSKSFTVTATAYTADCNGCSGVTSTGIDLKANPNTKVIAVDPSVIPLGSVVEVEGYGIAIAGDVGGAIKGNKIDVFVPSKGQASSWGVRTVKVTVK